MTGYTVRICAKNAVGYGNPGVSDSVTASGRHSRQDLPSSRPDKACRPGKTLPGKTTAPPTMPGRGQTSATR